MLKKFTYFARQQVIYNSSNHGKVKVHEDLKLFKAKNPVVTIGTFDGLHQGHQKVIRRLQDFATKHDGETVVFTFYPHPRLVTSPSENNLRLLTTLNEKIELFEKFGIDHLIIYPFDQTFAELTYQEFVKQILVDQINTHCLVIGYDHKFGKNREGGFEHLSKCASRYGFHIEKLDALSIEQENVSSTKIRKALQNGIIHLANEYLGYKFTLHGRVVQGEKVGRKLGFPTANIEASDKHKIIPGYGVYAVHILIDGTTYQGMLNIGIRPTFNKNADNRSIEVHIFDFNRDIYNMEITILFHGKIRNEQKFNSVQDLIKQLEIDKQQAMVLLS